jgi:4-carboxymuconolactone decarboxylase
MQTAADRLPPLSLEAMTPAQRAAAEAIIAGPRKSVAGPFGPMLRSPGLTDTLQKVGEYLRYGGAVPPRLKELAILTTARQWNQAYEWHVHAPFGLEAGLSRQLLAELAAGGAPACAAPDEATVHRFCVALHTAHAVDDETYAEALDLLGEEGVVDLAGVCGYYASLAMIMNVARSPIPDGAVPFAVPAPGR